MNSISKKIRIFSNRLPFPVVDANQDSLPQKLSDQLSATASSIHICTINAEIAHHLLNTSRSQVALRSVRYFIPDGIGVALAFKYLFGVDAGKLPGIEFADELLSQCNKLRWNVALYGATNERILPASEHIKQKYTNIGISAILDGYSSFDEVTNFLLQCQKDSVKLVLVALGHPAQDEFISKHLDSVPAIWVGVGGSFDVWSGAKQRAPSILSVSGLEWLYRILQDPTPKRIKRSIDLPLFCLDMLLCRIKAIFNRS